MKIADVLIHIDETISHEEHTQITASVRTCDGVTDVLSYDDKPHAMIVKYNPDKVSANDLLKIVLDSGVHAELIGL